MRENNKTREEINAAIKRGLRFSKETIGRPRSAKYDEIIKLRNKGYSIRKIAENIPCATGTVQHALKLYYDKESK